MRTLLFLILATAASCAFAQYRWVDDKGRVQYTDTPPPPSAKGVQRKSFGGGNTAKADDAGAQSAAMAAAVKANPIKLYTITNCNVGCAEAREHLKARGTPFTEVSVTDEKSMQELKRVSGGTYVPVLRVGVRVHMGFDSETYNEILDGAGYPK